MDITVKPQVTSKYRRWNSKFIINEIKTLQRLSPSYVRDHHPDLYGAAIRHFGSWKNAVSAVGMDHSKTLARHARGYWTREKVIEAIQKISEKYSADVRKKHLSLYSAAIRIFGSWDDALIASGIDCEAVKISYRKRRRLNSA